MDMFSFMMGVILGVGIPYAIVEVRDFLFRRSVRRMAPELPKVWADSPPRLQCPLPSPHSRHDERVCAIAWYLKHQDASLPVLPYEKLKADPFPTMTAKQAVDSWLDAVDEDWGQNR